MGADGMPRTSKKVSEKRKPLHSAGSERAGPDFEEDGGSGQTRAPKPAHSKPGQRKRGWRDIEAISERARLKKMLSDIWHEDVELDEDIFGESDHLAGYYTDVEEEVEEIEVDNDLEDDEDFDETEE